jgi:hypothetical protein
VTLEPERRPGGGPSATLGVLLLADISGYTRFLRAVEDAHRDDAFAGDSVPDVMAHRLLKSGASAVVGHGAYLLATDSAARQLNLPTEAALPLVEEIEHYVPVQAHVYSATDLAA